jgi:hypothetical protein
MAWLLGGGGGSVLKKKGNTMIVDSISHREKALQEKSKIQSHLGSNQ